MAYANRLPHGKSRILSGVAQAPPGVKSPGSRNQVAARGRPHKTVAISACIGLIFGMSQRACYHERQISPPVSLVGEYPRRGKGSCSRRPGLRVYWGSFWHFEVAFKRSLHGRG
jgi:hypothetical protein